MSESGCAFGLYGTENSRFSRGTVRECFVGFMTNRKSERRYEKNKIKQPKERALTSRISRRSRRTVRRSVKQTGGGGNGISLQNRNSNSGSGRYKKQTVKR